MESILNQILERLTQLQSDMNAMKAEVNDIKAKMATQEELKALKSEVNDIKAKMATKEELEALKSEVNDIKAKMVTKEDLAPIQQAVLETNDIVKSIELNQERHERILDVLSKRSIEHEADIASLRRVK